MGIYIPNMEKPKICGECPLFIDHCYFDGNEWHNGCFSLEREIFEDELAPDCPLIDIVTCWECKHVVKLRSESSAEKFGQIYECRKGILNCPKSNDFCSYGERRSE